jgi:hypothetical protein
VITPGLIFAGKECASQYWSRPEHREEICCDSPRVDPLRILHAGEREFSSIKRRHFLKNSVLIFEIQKVRRRENHSTMPATAFWLYAPHHHELLRVLVCEGVRDCGVQRAENGRVHADT